jgi:hypothetical protein
MNERARDVLSADSNRNCSSLCGSFKIFHDENKEEEKFEIYLMKGLEINCLGLRNVSFLAHTQWQLDISEEEVYGNQ